MAKVTTMEKVGMWSFYVGALIALILGIVGDQWWTVSVLLVLGLVVGLLNVTDKEIIPFLVACIALILAGSAASGILPWMWLRNVLGNIVVFVLPAAIIGSLKAIYAVTSSR